MSKKRITYTIDQKIKDYNKLLVSDRTNPKLKELEEYINFYYFGIVI